MELSKAVRVVRGPDWSWGDQDGGEGGVGTVVEVGEEGKSVLVQWDYGIRARYRSGAEDKFDLRVFDTAPTGLKFPEVICCGCYVEGVAGTYWQCAHCYEYHLCHSCYLLGRHCQEHPFFRIQSGKQTRRLRVSPRVGAKRVEARGIFPGAEVVRGPNWKFKDQDGGAGMTGKVVAIEGWKDETARSVAKVQWSTTGKINIYRVGHRGKIDLKCTSIGKGGHYYPEHFPALGQRIEWFCEDEIVAGDVVKVELDPDLFKMMHEAVGLWSDDYTKILFRSGVVLAVLDCHRLVCCFDTAEHIVSLCTDAVTKMKPCRVGETVQVISDVAELHRVHEEEGIWNDDLVLMLGEVGRVTRVYIDGKVQVSIHGMKLLCNPQCLLLFPGEAPPECVIEVENLGMMTNITLKSFREEMRDKGFVDETVLDGDLTSLRKFLENNRSGPAEPKEELLAYFSAAGMIPSLKILLEHGIDPNVKNVDGSIMAAVCLMFNQEESCLALLEAGGDINCDFNGGSMVMVAAMLGSPKFLKSLATHPHVMLNRQSGNAEEDTALHLCVKMSNYLGVAILVAANADPTICRKTLENPIHYAAHIGMISLMEVFAVHCPEHMNIQNQMGWSPIHFAADNNHYMIVNLLASQNSVDINAETHDKATPLHLAAHQGHWGVVECLVGWGAVLNATDVNGNTPLHHIISCNRQSALGSTRVKLVRDNLSENSGRSVEGHIAVVCFLVQEGADWDITNKEGVSSRQKLAPDITSLIADYVKNHPGSFHGSLHSTQQCRMSELPQRLVLAPSQSTAISQPFTSSCVDSVSPKTLTADNSPSTVQPAPQVVGDESAEQHAQLCMLCEEHPASVKFNPCGHTVLCSGCAERAKKCLHCKAYVQSKTNE